jgi:hypothetical protein
VSVNGFDSAEISDPLSTTQKCIRNLPEMKTITVKRPAYLGSNRNWFFCSACGESSENAITITCEHEDDMIYELPCNVEFITIKIEVE